MSELLREARGALIGGLVVLTIWAQLRAWKPLWKADHPRRAIVIKWMLFVPAKIAAFPVLVSLVML